MNRLRQSFGLSSLRTGLPVLRRSSALPPALLLLALSSAFVFDNQRDLSQHRAQNTYLTTQTLILAANLSPEHNFRMFLRQTLDADGELTYEPYNRFPIGAYALTKLAILPFGDDLAAQILAARLLMLALFAATALLAYLSLRRLMPSRWIALAATLLTFSSYYWLYYNDMVSSEVASAFGVTLTFHGIVLFAQEGRYRQLLIKACIALLLGWHVYALLLAFIVIGLPGEIVGALWERRSLSPMSQVKGALLTLIRSRYIRLGVVTMLFGLAVLGFNFANEYYALQGKTPLTELPTFQSMLERVGEDEEFSGRYADVLEWRNFARGQFYRIGGLVVPYGVPGYGATGLGWTWGTVPALGTGIVLGVAACAVCLIGLIYTRHKHLFATLVLAGFFWAIPMRRHTAFHDFETIFYTGIPLFVFALALLGARRLLGDRAVGGLAVGAAALFAVSAFQMSAGYEPEVYEFHDAAVADFKVIRPITDGKTVFVHQESDDREFSDAWRSTHYYLAGNYYLAGSAILFSSESDRRDLADFVVMRERKPGAALLTPDNRSVFLYDRAAYDAQWMAELRESAADAMEQAIAAPAKFDLRWHDGRLIYAKENCDSDDIGDRFYLHITPRNVADLTAESRQFGFDNLDFEFWEYGARSDDGRCLAIAPLPEYEIDSIRTGQFGVGDAIWSAEVNADLLSYLGGFAHIYEGIVAGDYGDPIAESAFRIYIRDNELVYHKPECAAADIELKFLLHIVPQNVADLPSDRQESGFDNLDFRFADYGASLVDGCVALVPLPEYEIDSIRTGQFGDMGSVWRVEFAAP